MYKRQVLAGFIASSIGDRPGLVAGFAAGALAKAGVAGFLGARIGGFLAGYVVVLLRKVFKGLPKSLDGIKTILFYPVFGLIITGLLMLVINIPMKAINDALNHFLLGMLMTLSLIHLFFIIWVCICRALWRLLGILGIYLRFIRKHELTTL